MKQVELEPSHTHRRISKLAIAGTVAGPIYVGLVWLNADLIASWRPDFLVTLIICGVLVAPIVGMLLCIAALVRIRRAGGALGGEKLARFGRDLNILIIVLLIALWWFVVPAIS